jgi:hypothetical protein
MRWRGHIVVRDRRRHLVVRDWRGHIVLFNGVLSSGQIDAHPGRGETRSDPSRDPGNAGSGSGDVSMRVHAGNRRIVRLPGDRVLKSVAGCIANVCSCGCRLSDFERSTGGVERHDRLSLRRAASATDEEQQSDLRPENPRRDYRAPLDEMSQESASRRRRVRIADSATSRFGGRASPARSSS